jgi:four helix bundle protein
MEFLVLDKSLELIRLLRPLVVVIRRHDPKLVGQIRDAANSAGQNLAEGNGRVGRDRLHLWRVALTSAEEVHMELRQAEAWGYVKPADIAQALDVANHLIRVIQKLLR